MFDEKLRVLYCVFNGKEPTQGECLAIEDDGTVYLFYLRYRSRRLSVQFISCTNKEMQQSIEYELYKYIYLSYLPKSLIEEEGYMTIDELTKFTNHIFDWDIKNEKEYLKYGYLLNEY